MRIRRPLYFIALAFAAAIVVRHYFGLPAAIGPAIVLFLITTAIEIFTVGEQNSRRLLCVLLLAAYCVSLLNVAFCDARFAKDPMLNAVSGQKQDSSSSKKQGNPVELVGIVKDPSIYIDSMDKTNVRLELEVRQINGQPISGGRTLLTIPLKSMEGTPIFDNTDSAPNASAVLRSIPPESVIWCTGIPKLPAEHRNPNCFDYRLYLKTCGVQTTLRPENVKMIRSGAGTLRGRLFLLREHYLARLEGHAGADIAGMLRAVLFGQKSQLDEETETLFKNNGTAHILAVSGLHVGMLYAAFAALWAFLAARLPSVFGVRKGVRFFICTALVFGCYAFMAGSTPSVVRAVFMVLLHAFASVTGRRYDLNCAGFAVGLAEMLRNPYIIFHAGFQMSFLAILSLGLIIPYLNRLYTGALAGSIAIQIGLGPYIAYQYNILSLIAVFINVPAIFLAGIIVPAGMAGMLLPGITGLYDQGVAWLCGMMLKMNELACVEHVTSMTVASPPIWMIAAFYLGLLVFASEEGRLLFLRHRYGVIKALVIAVLAAAVAFGQAADDGFRDARLVFVDVGQGDCMHFRSGGRNYLIDGGGSMDYDVGTKTLKPYLLRNGVRCVDGAFVTHLHTDHYRGICELAKAGMIRRIYVYEGNRLKLDQIREETGLAKENIVFLKQGQKVRFSKSRGGLTDSLEILWPPGKTDADYARMLQDEENENASSLIMRACLAGVSLLATGDLGEEGERELIQQEENRQELSRQDRAFDPLLSRLHVDVLKVGHHGSKTSSSDAFLDIVQPRIAVIQVGEHNFYGHPTPETLRRLTDRHITVCRNDRQGAVGMFLRKGRIVRIRTVVRYKKQP